MEGRIALSNKALATVGLVAAYIFVACLCGSSRVDAAETSIITCARKSQMTTCVCSTRHGGKEEASDSTDTATLSESSNGIAIQCPKPTFEFVPSDASTVCTAETAEHTERPLEGCSKKSSNASIANLLNLATDAHIPKWTTATSEHTLVVPEDAFPLVDKSFIAGCFNKNGDEPNGKECVVKVSVKARTSAVKDGVLTCAYGTESNSSVPEVTLNSENNSLTILCGSEGVMQPNKDSLTAYYCAGSNTTDCKEVNLTEIMPTFTSSWWITDENNDNAPKLVIPEDGFPSQKETILLGCNPNKNVVSRAEDGEGSTAAQLPTCKVKVTLSAQSSGSDASNVSFLVLTVLVFISLVVSSSY
ncbi:srs domain-containing protein [Neospora caninum Liverpool]|uniref:Srs domain-containing protein n=1 Tax=Neospora caninum (strain Liverpool) TaxID=572307 RepID=F0VCG0_NEOCL|nr:srs domain-containing protein [Neospora caninum Liverpool]CBZ51282.1 srs domain-containing protein [Neospora caninum Liverpool]CEL68597.1 TPA: SRS domain-containing protein [Neospora caninum Liverpool]|eukprot:XP_003881315.1 srs domain-containing protein [Neospora caninum Liverpool]